MGKSIFDNPDYNSPFGNWLETDFTGSINDNKRLSIKFVEWTSDDNYVYMTFEITAKNLSKYDAKISVEESEVIFNESVITETTVSINPNGSRKVTVKFSRNKKMSKSWFEGNFEYIGIVKCDGLTAVSSEFSITGSNKGKPKNDNNKESSNTETLNYNVCPIDPKYRSHFILHCTAGNMSLEAIKKHTNYDKPNRSRSKAHVYLMKDGSTLFIWPFSEKNVWATKVESKRNLKGQMFHVEINYGSPDKPTNEQYESLADLYIEASSVEKCWPIIVPHIEVDRGIPDGHSDPTDFDYNYFYKILESKGVPIETIPKFDHDRYWGSPSYKVPWGSDKNSWPPILKGNPHK